VAGIFSFLLRPTLRFLAFTQSLPAVNVATENEAHQVTALMVESVPAHVLIVQIEAPCLTCADIEPTRLELNLTSLGLWRFHVITIPQMK
jgi:hypothetical protein